MNDQYIIKAQTMVDVKPTKNTGGEVYYFADFYISNTQTISNAQKEIVYNDIIEQCDLRHKNNNYSISKIEYLLLTRKSLNELKLI